MQIRVNSKMFPKKYIFVKGIELDNKTGLQGDVTKAVLVVDEIKKDQSRVESIINKIREIK